MDYCDSIMSVGICYGNTPNDLFKKKFGEGLLDLWKAILFLISLVNPQLPTAKSLRIFERVI